MTKLEKKHTASAKAPSVADFVALRATAGWGAVSEFQAAKSLDNSLAFATVYVQEQLIAMGRIVGDGSLFFYIQDVVVHPNYQDRGFGRSVLEVLELYIKREAKSGATVALLSAQGKENFYSAFGYESRTGVPLGFGMCKFIS